jgi:uncharacterized protein YkwD/uncharacterized membrane protein required for colicin V production
MDISFIYGNWVDFIIILVLIYYIFEGVRRGFLMGFIDLLGFLVSFAAALRSYALLGNILFIYFSLPKGISNAIGFLLAGFISEFIYTIVVEYFYKKTIYIYISQHRKDKYISIIHYMDKSLGVIPAVFEALIFTAFIMMLLIVFPIEGGIKKDIVSSRIGGELISKTQNIDRLLNNIFGEALNETLTFLTVNSSPGSNERVSLHFTVIDPLTDEQSEQTMFYLVNSERLKNGFRKLEFSNDLKNLAREYGRDMFRRGYFSHYNLENLSPFDRMENAKIKFLVGGENLALAPNVNLAHQGLMNSPGHRANILSPDFNKIGIGVVDGGMYGEIFVQEFTD